MDDKSFHHLLLTCIAWWYILVISFQEPRDAVKVVAWWNAPCTRQKNNNNPELSFYKINNSKTEPTRREKSIQAISCQVSAERMGKRWDPDTPFAGILSQLSWISYPLCSAQGSKLWHWHLFLQALSLVGWHGFQNMTRGALLLSCIFFITEHWNQNKGLIQCFHLWLMCYICFCLTQENNMNVYNKQKCI